ncbi:MAG: ASCH domain-containing protein [Candidatus Diapherotrites archaeon]|nr:ASCH domain-containing protein [Candidatus Diapherotrites archaeon]
MKGLIIKKPFIDLILDGRKPVEIRKSRTKYRGKVVLLWRGKAYGVVEIVDVVELNPDEMELSPEERAFLKDYAGGKKLYGWVLKNPLRFREPVPVELKRGVQTWVRLKEDDLKRIREAEDEARRKGY